MYAPKYIHCVLTISQSLNNLFFCAFFHLVCYLQKIYLMNLKSVACIGYISQKDINTYKREHKTFHLVVSPILVLHNYFTHTRILPVHKNDTHTFSGLGE